MRSPIALFLLLGAGAGLAQPAGHFILGEEDHTWANGGNGRDPTLLVSKYGSLNVINASAVEDTTNAPGGTISFDHRPGWISPLFFEEDENIANRVLEVRSGITTSSVSIGEEVLNQLQGMVNGDHLVAFERKPTPLNPEIRTQDVQVTLDLGVPMGIHRIRFYPRNTVVATPSRPFQFDFLRGYEVWINPALTDLRSPDLLVKREPANEEPVVDLKVAPQYARLVKLKSLATAPFELDELEVYGTGYLQQATYLSDILDLGDRATVGPVRWIEEAVGDSLFSRLSLRVRTGSDDTPVLYRRVVRDAKGRTQGFQELTPRQYYALDPRDQARLEEDAQHWSPWKTLENGSLPSAPMPRRYLQFQFEFSGELFAARQVDRLEFEYLQPPIADTLRAEVYPRLAEAEKPATFRYAMRLGAAGPIRGFDHLEVDTNGKATSLRALQVNGRPVEFAVDFIRPDGFGLSFPLVKENGAIVEFTFELPIFRFGTTFSGRVFNRESGDVPQALEPGNVVSFGPDDLDELSNLFVAIPKKQIGRLVGQIALSGGVFTPNGDGVNDRMEIAFNLLQLLRPVPVVLEVYDLAGRRLGTAFAEELGIGEVARAWDGRLEGGGLALPGIYIWVLRVEADAFEERHSGTVGVVY